MSWSRPPRVLRKAQFDNILLIPASALPEKSRYQAIANGLPQGDVLIVLPHANPTERQFLETVRDLFRAKGRAVTLLTRTDDRTTTVIGPDDSRRVLRNLTPYSAPDKLSSGQATSLF